MNYLRQSSTTINNPNQDVESSLKKSISDPQFSGEIIIIYEHGHVDEAKRRVAQDVKIICLDYLLEQKCQKQNIPFVPQRTLVEKETGEEEWWILSHQISREWYRLPDMEFFQYKGIRIAEAPEPIMQAYLAKLFYFLRVFMILKSKYPNAIFSIPDPLSTNFSKGECLAVFQPWAVIDAARMAGLKKDLPKTRMIPKFYKFASRTWGSRYVRWYNFFVGLIPKHKFKIYLSGYWTHAESIVPLLDETDIILLERRRIINIPFWQLLRHRIKVMYSHGPINNDRENEVKKSCADFVEKWQNAKGQVAEYLVSLRNDLDWGPVLEACEHLIIYAPRVVADIDILIGIMKREKPNVVLQMASVGGPHHYFFLMAQVAKLLNIPSIELQHATVTSDPRSVFCRIETDYLLTYGESINILHKNIGNDPGKLISVGSPRFDRYVNDFPIGLSIGKEIFKKIGLDISRPILLVVVPFSETYASAVDSYELAEFLKMIRVVQKNNPGLQIAFKCRVPKLIDVTKEYLRDLFFVDWAILADEDIFPLLCASDVVICNNSTVIYQAVLVKKPLVLHPWKKFDYYHAQIYAPFIPLVYSADEAIETLSRIFQDKSYRRGLLEKQEQFLKGYLFDGKSSERTVRVIREIAGKDSKSQN